MSRLIPLAVAEKVGVRRSASMHARSAVCVVVKVRCQLLSVDSRRLAHATLGARMPEWHVRVIFSAKRPGKNCEVLAPIKRGLC